MRTLKMRSTVASHEMVTPPIKRIMKVLILNLTAREVGEELHVDHFMTIWPLKQTGKVKKHNKWVPQIKKIVVWKCHLLLLYATTMNHFFIGLWCATKSGFSTGDDQLSGWTMNKLPKHFPKPTYTKKGSWSLVGGLFPVWSTTALWIQVKLWHLRSMLSK